MSKLMWLVVIIAAVATAIYLMQNYTALGLTQIVQPFKDGLTRVFERITVYVKNPGQMFSDVSTFSIAIVGGLFSTTTGLIVGAIKDRGKAQAVAAKDAINAEVQKKLDGAKTQITTITSQKDNLTTKVDLLEQTVQTQEKYYEGILNEQKGKIAAMGEQISKLIDEKTQLQRLLAQEKVIIKKSVP